MKTKLKTMKTKTKKVEAKKEFVAPKECKLTTAEKIRENFEKSAVEYNIYWQENRLNKTEYIIFLKNELAILESI